MTTPDRDEPRSPVRSCLGCRTRRASSELVRLTRVSGAIVADGASDGRGAWLCRAAQAVRSCGDGSSTLESIVVPGCLDAALARQAFAKAWRSPVGADDERAIRGVVERRALGPGAPSDATSDGGGR